MLKREFLDKEFIIEETYKNILNSNPGTNIHSDYTSIKIHANETRANIAELKKHGLDLLEPNTPGHSYQAYSLW